MKTLSTCSIGAYKRVGLPEEFHTARPKRLCFLLLNTLGKVVRHARETLLRCTKEIARALADAPRTIFSLNRPALAGFEDRLQRFRHLWLRGLNGS